MGRVKKERIKTLEEVNGALGEIAKLRRKLSEIEVELNEDVDRLKKTAKAKSAPLMERIKALENGMEAWADFNKDLFDGPRTKVLTFGVIGFRRRQVMKPERRKTWKLVLESVKSYAFTEALRFKEELNREELEKWNKEKLSLVGVVRKEEDRFYYNLNEEQLK